VVLAGKIGKATGLAQNQLSAAQQHWIHNAFR
jgi:hypothetical protein